MCNLFFVHYISIIHFQIKRNKLDTLSLILSWKAWNYVKSLFSYVTYKINITMGVIDVQAGFEKAEEQEIWWPTSTGLLKKQESSRKASISALLMMPKPLPVWITINWKILKEMGIPDHLTCLLRNLYASQEATIRTGHGRTDWLQIGKGVHQSCILSPCLFNLHAEYIMRDTGLEETQLESDCQEKYQ